MNIEIHHRLECLLYMDVAETHNTEQISWLIANSIQLFRCCYVLIRHADTDHDIYLLKYGWRVISKWSIHWTWIDRGSLHQAQWQQCSIHIVSSLCSFRNKYFVVLCTTTHRYQTVYSEAVVVVDKAIGLSCCTCVWGVIYDKYDPCYS
jgi:hypothetical protein